MTTINNVSSYSAYQRYAGVNIAGQQSGGAASGSKAGTDANAATLVELSDAAQKKLGEKSFADVTADARGKLDTLLAAAGLDSPYADGELAIDLADLDRRELFAIASNNAQSFSADEQKAAMEDLLRRFDQAMAGPAAVVRVTDELMDLYTAARDYLDKASDEEKASLGWQTEKAAVAEAIAQLASDPESVPNIANDPVADYAARLSDGETAQPRDFGDIASDARAALDKQYADAEANGEALIFSQRRQDGQRADFSDFDSRTLSAVAMNEGGQFKSEEVLAAKKTLHRRSCDALLACINNAGESADPGALSKSIISVYGSLSAEERTATGWNDSFYENALTNYRSTMKITEMLNGTTTNSGSSGLLGQIGG